MKAKKEGYLIHESRGKFTLCKIIKEYGTKEEAIKDLSLILSKSTKEENIKE